ncbi:MAG TPA: hypothetical protein VGO93_18740 [Candidatus Xenobia bacterium]|jgi:hypothetical protein
MMKMMTWLKSLARSESKPNAGPPLQAGVPSAELLTFTDQKVGYMLHYSASIELDASESLRRHGDMEASSAGLQWVMHRWIDKKTEELAWRMHLIVQTVPEDMRGLPALSHLVTARQMAPSSVSVVEEPQFCAELPGMSSFSYVSRDSGLQTQHYAVLDLNEERLFRFTALTHSQVHPIARGKWERILASFQFFENT